MADKIERIEGVGAAYAAKLNEAGIRFVGEYLDKASTKKGREAIAAQTGISETLVLKWANHADLMRVHGIGGQYAELLEVAGVDTVKELATRSAENLTVKLVEANQARKLSGNDPALKQVRKWIDGAKALTPKVSH